MASQQPLLVPVQLDAFVLNPAVCGKPEDTGARICPITQPNYTFLRFRDFVAESDLQPHADLHNAAPAQVNSRLTDLGARPPTAHRHRHGVYVHWSLPRAYRTGISFADSVKPERRNEERIRHGLPPEGLREQPGSGLSAAAAAGTTPAPVAGNVNYIEPPTRWLVVRKLDLGSVRPETAQPFFKNYEAWVVESDYLWKLDEIPDDYDLQVDMAPYIVATPGEDVNVEQQAEMFIGRKTPLAEWKNEPQPAGTPTPDLRLLSSGNQLFADFQMHNSNVFSILDNFRYVDVEGTVRYLNAATASYYVVGWHRDDATDPLWMRPENQRSRTMQLDSLFMALEEGDEWLKETGATRLLCHGAMYDVRWDHSKKPDTVPADRFADRLQSQVLPAVSVGTTPLDALITYCTARKGNRHSEAKIAKLEEKILAIQSLLHTRDDGVEGQRQAKDIVYNWNFSRAPGGVRYFLSEESPTDSDKPRTPSEGDRDDVRQLNRHQGLLDGFKRSCLQWRWEMFALWWKYITNPGNRSNDEINDEYREATDALELKITNAQNEIQKLEISINGLCARLKNTQLGKDVKSGTHPFFYRARDPTILVGGVDSGWPTDYAERLSVRLPNQTVAKEERAEGLESLIATIQAKFGQTATVNEGMRDAVSNLLKEFGSLMPTNDRPLEVPEGKKFPQFHDDEMRDQWNNQQPWRPLYMEWEVEYFHIPFEDWALDEYGARLSDNKQVRYGIKAPDEAPLWKKLPPDEKTQDRRILSGRVLILPQPTFSLHSKMEQLFSDTSAEILDKHLSKEKQAEVLEGVKTLPYLSAPLSGLTEGLLTLATGSHIKPENKEINAGLESLSVISSARFDDAGFTESNLRLIQGNSALTPFAAMADFSQSAHCPFKPVTHGQFRFRKMNIIDKFGQTLVAIDQRPRESGPPPLYPCISDFYSPQIVDNTGNANTVLQDHNRQCEFIQLPPQINQNSRLNAEFMMRTGGDITRGAAGWRPATEWENPVWGWIVTNYADYGIQFFLPTGKFYCQVRFGGPEGVLEEPKWIPFEPPTPEEGAPVHLKQLNALIKQLHKKEYMDGFWSMILTALDCLPPTPHSYAQYLTAIVGKPLALVDMGWSLELDGPPLENQSLTAANLAPPRQLTKALPTDEVYSLQVKLGDKEREYDGLVGYMKMDAHNNLNLDTIHTYFADKDGQAESGDPRQMITSNEYPNFTPFWISPFKEPGSEGAGEPKKNSKARTPDEYENLRNKEWQVFGAIVDPFTPVHAFSSFLPARSLQLPPWTWQEAMNRITAFFHAGPLLLTSDIKNDTLVPQPATDNDGSAITPAVALPSLGGADWNWLQPYVDPTSERPGTDQPAETEAQRKARLNIPPVFDLYEIDNRTNLQAPGFQRGPYTAIKGFLQLKRPVMKED